MRRAALLVTLSLAADASAHRPTPARAFSNGLPPGNEVGGIVVLQTPASDRVFIPGGTFKMGSAEYELALGSVLCQKEALGLRCKPHGDPPQLPEFLRMEMPAHPVTISAFHIDRTEVTVDAYRRCASAGQCATPGFPALDPRYDNPAFPVTHVSWDDAVQYCKYAGGRLPTEAEWEFAARGEAGRAFPWGNVYNPHLCNHGSFALDPTDASDGFGGLAPVGSFKNGATPLGVLDMAGNVSEWVEDRIEPAPDSGFPGYSWDPCDDEHKCAVGSKCEGRHCTPTNPVVTKGSYHLHRGGSYTDGAHQMRSTTRTPLQGIIRLADIGFRCAYGGR